MTLTCANCHAEVARSDCHRNRYGEMICHPCQRAGVKFTWRRRLRTSSKKIPLYAGIAVAVTTAVLLLAWFLHLIWLSEPQRLLH